ncbi:3-hydroxy-3-methylglutaryl-CoA reductase [Sphingobacterium alkalisoli]|uniref:hydroxymethylglutaryl-CoA reductase (NADPH) n=1 Tax=Sphingobacterium alkalisoli TaxID=1874115 RepID=A0A4U0H4C9_9SPHI|nr:hydroxymethylglutaryl-CoA reductase [Sphingobacterium alkalisoli]TJY66448.1 3-hydroxy-3-methylglutaryl-CoA reductase [Sphingobacterium alkalisoli]GGH16344.1 3-hydroxy-3-methylglutaryl-CoA reductase [Sphingobacterium alkalisoli]
MASSLEKASTALHIINTVQQMETIIEHIRDKESWNSLEEDALPLEQQVSEDGMQKRRSFLLQKTNKDYPYLIDNKAFEDYDSLNGNIENFIGMSRVPTGVIGPLRIIGSSAQGDFYVPLATTEGALVASYNRGAKACYLAGGAISICLMEGVQRSPVFKFENIADLGLFVAWLLPQVERFKEIVGETSRYAKLMDVKIQIEGNHLIVIFEFHTGDAAGQNMVTICTDAICRYIIAQCPTKPTLWFIEGNYSGDKKATALSFSNVRGKKVTTEIVLSEAIVHNVLKTTPDLMAEYWRSSTMGIIQSGAIGAHGHYANGLAALFLATGQDVACVAEAATGVTRMEMNKDGSLYASVTLPNLVVGTVGGGTHLPTQRECLEMMDCYGQGKARKFAEICGALILAGELSIAAALSAGHFTQAHKQLGRKK